MKIGTSQHGNVAESGLLYRPGKAELGKPGRGFESHRYRQKHMYVDILLSTLIKQTLKSSPQFTGQWSSQTWLAEHRTVTLGVPRRSGKTTALVNLYQSRPSLLFASGHRAAEGITNSFGVQCLIPADWERPGVRCQHQVELILLDELLTWGQEQRRLFYEFVTMLHHHRQLSDNIVIVNVGT